MPLTLEWPGVVLRLARTVIGGGANLRRGESVEGVATAATLWPVTIIVLGLGGGQLALGAAATVLSLLIL
jgi:putative Mg2+ transporter-C (MgtC) family protein